MKTERWLGESNYKTGISFDNLFFLSMVRVKVNHVEFLFLVGVTLLGLGNMP